MRQHALEVAASSERFWAKVDKTGTCWLWTGAVSSSGYGVFAYEGSKTAYSHRITLAWSGVELAGEMVIDHLCRTPLCVNPAHLEQVTPKENIARGLQGALKSHCPQGHPWVEENQYVRPGTGRKMCLACRSERNKINNANRRKETRWKKAP